MSDRPPSHHDRPAEPASEAAPDGRSEAVVPRGAVARVVFGKRLPSPQRHVSFRREKLRILEAELNLLFAYRIDATTCFAALEDAGEEAGSGEGNAGQSGIPEPVLVLGRSVGLSLTVEIEAESGLFVLHEQMPLAGGGTTACILITASEERLIDQIVGTVSAQTGERTPRTTDAAIDGLVGRPLAEVERHLVLRTLLRFNGDRGQTAFALGIDESVLRAKLRRYFIDNWRSLDAPEEPQ